MGYKVKWRQTIALAGSTSFVTETFKLETSGTLRETKPLNSTWGKDGISGIYSGTNGNNLNGSYCVLEFPDLKETENQFDSYSLRMGGSNGQMNLRFMFNFGSASARQGFKWTGIEDTVVNSYNASPQQPPSGTSLGTAQISWLDPYIQNAKSITIGSTQNSPYFTTFATELQINDLIFVPYFVIKTVKITTKVESSTNPIVTIDEIDSNYFTWSQIKPEDKTPEGSLYQTYKNLFNSDFEIISTDATSKTIQYCAGVIMSPYYGKSSYTYNPDNDTYTQAPISSIRYGNREILGSVPSYTGEYPCNQSTPYLSVFYEQNIPELKGVYYGTSAGVLFGHGTAQNILIDKFSIASVIVTPTGDYSKINNTNYNINPLCNNSGNTSYGGILSTIKIDDSPVLVIPSILGTSGGGKISSFVDATTTSSGNQLFEEGTTNIVRCGRGRAFSPWAYLACFQINDLWSTIMSYGCYIADATEHAQIAPLGDKINGNNHIYCGNMDGNFVTDGTPKQGSDIENLPQTKIGDIIKETPYKPVNPEGGGSDPDDDKAVNPNRVEGVNMGLQTGRTLGTGLGFITMYNLDYSQLQTLGNVLWGSFADYDPYNVDPNGEIVHNFYIQLANEVTGTFDTSAILNYFVSLRQYPFSVGTLPVTTAFGSDIYIGNGKVGIPIGSGVRILTSSIGLLNAGSCLIKPVTPYNDFKDYYNTTVSVYLPYCGSIELNPTEVINQTISCVYAIDFYTGECTAYLTVDGNPSYIIGVANGVIGVDVPLTASAEAQLQARHTMDSVANARLISSFILGGIEVAPSIATGNFAGMLMGSQTMGKAVLEGATIDAERQSRSGVAAPYLSGGAGSASFFSPDSVYAIIRRGTYKRPDNYPHTVGYPSTKSGLLGSFNGYTVCANPDVSSLNCTVEEKNMIKNYLSNGVIV